MAKFCYCARVLVCLSVSLIMLGNGYVVESGAVAICKPPLIPGPAGKYCYDFQPNPGKLSWIGAQDFCLEKGGNLATLRTLKEVDFITRKMSEHHLDAAYLGFRAVMNSSNWRWVDDNTKIDTDIAEPHHEIDQALTVRVKMCRFKQNDSCVVVNAYRRNIYQDNKSPEESTQDKTNKQPETDPTKQTDNTKQVQDPSKQVETDPTKQGSPGTEAKSGKNPVPNNSGHAQEGGSGTDTIPNPGPEGPGCPGCGGGGGGPVIPGCDGCIFPGVTIGGACDPSCCCSAFTDCADIVPGGGIPSQCCTGCTGGSGLCSAPCCCPVPFCAAGHPELCGPVATTSTTTDATTPTTTTTTTPTTTTSTTTTTPTTTSTTSSTSTTTPTTTSTTSTTTPTTTSTTSTTSTTPTTTSTTPTTTSTTPTTTSTTPTTTVPCDLFPVCTTDADCCYVPGLINPGKCNLDFAGFCSCRVATSACLLNSDCCGNICMGGFCQPAPTGAYCDTGFPSDCASNTCQVFVPPDPDSATAGLCV